MVDLLRATGDGGETPGDGEGYQLQILGRRPMILVRAKRAAPSNLVELGRFLTAPLRPADPEPTARLAHTRRRCISSPTDRVSLALHSAPAALAPRGPRLGLGGGLLCLRRAIRFEVDSRCDGSRYGSYRCGVAGPCGVRRFASGRERALAFWQLARLSRYACRQGGGQARSV